MFIKGSLREHERSPFVKPLRYSLVCNEKSNQRKITKTGVSVDISKGGLGIITDYQLHEGNLVTFENGIKMKNEKLKKAAVVKWSGKMYGKYRIGLAFILNQ